MKSPSRAVAVRPAQQALAPNRIRFDINRITLHGFVQADQARFTRALESRLAALASPLNGHDWSTALPQNIGHLDAGLLRPGATPEEAASHIASQIHAAFTRRKEGARHV